MVSDIQHSENGSMLGTLAPRQHTRAKNRAKFSHAASLFCDLGYGQPGGRRKCWNQAPWIRIPMLPLISSINLGKPLNLCFSVFICKMGIRTLCTQRVVMKVKGAEWHRVSTRLYEWLLRKNNKQWDVTKSPQTFQDMGVYPQTLFSCDATCSFCDLDQSLFQGVASHWKTGVTLSLSYESPRGSVKSGISKGHSGLPAWIRA